MVQLTAPYIIPLFLGMTFNARYTKPGVDIYDMKYVNDPDIVSFHTESSKYKVTQNMSDVADALSVSGDLALKIKSGMIDIAGKGSYLKNNRDFQKTVEILTTAKYKSTVRSLKADAIYYSDWYKRYNPSVLGTHYVTSITYGAEMIASARFVVFNSSDTQDVRAEVEAKLGTGGNGNELVAKGKLESLEKSLTGKANLEISYYGTVPLKSIPNSIEGLRSLITNFKELVEETHMKEGVPMEVALSPLTSIAPLDQADKFAFLKNWNLEDQLSNFEIQLDDLRSARSELVSYTKTLPYDLSSDIENQVGLLLKNMTLITQKFFDTIWLMDLTKGPEQLQTAFDAYNYDQRDTYKRFNKLVRRLVKDVEKKIDRENVATDTYIQWGNNNCTAERAKVLYEGFAFSSSEEGIGGSAEYSCAPRAPRKGYDLSESGKKSHISGIRYTDFDKESNPFKGSYAKKIAKQGIPCAKCHSLDSASVAMFSATDNCPITWEAMYSGYLMSSRNQDGHTTEYICVDENPSDPWKMTEQPKNADTAALTTVQSSGSLPKDYKNGALVRCVLCSMKVNQVTF